MVGCAQKDITAARGQILPALRYHGSSPQNGGNGFILEHPRSDVQRGWSCLTQQAQRGHGGFGRADYSGEGRGKRTRLQRRIR